MLGALIGLLLLIPPVAASAADVEAQVPDALKPWIPWVLEGKDQRACPIQGEGGQRLCAWPGRLDLDLTAAGGLFAQQWRVYAESWVPLPGAADNWPQEVRVGSQGAAVVEHDGTPALKLEPGDWAVTGRFVWPKVPDGLSVPPATGLVSLRLGGAVVPFPRRDRDGRLWLSEGAGQGPQAGRDTLSLDVYRRVDDDTPLQVFTRMELDVTGRPREVRLGPVLLVGGIPLGVTSPLPARLEPDGSLRLQVRPGRWVVEVTGYHPHPLDRLALGPHPAPWPKQEAWVFAAHPELRQVEIAGAQPLDPRQTRLPPGWARLPAYLLRPGGHMELKQTGRGDAEPAPDRLTLKRDLWLDFAGTGYTARDRIDGVLSRSWRLETGEALALGQVLVDGQPRFITRLGDAPRRGVEVRQGRLQLVADSRIEGDIHRVPASGWALDLRSVQTSLHLPPGWDLLAVGGVDNLPATWLNRWTLMDLFLVLITALAAGRLWGWPWGLLMLATLTLTWQAPGAPRFVWLNLLAAIALLRLLPKEPTRAAMARLRRALLLYYRGSLVVLALIALPFLVDQARTAIYPQLERPQTQFMATRAKAVPSPAMSLMQDAAVGLSAPRSRIVRKAEEVAGSAPAPLPVVDPNARVQTGPGVPSWQWTQVELSWSGPLPRDHAVRLWLVSPREKLAMALLSILLVLAVGLKVSGLSLRLPKRTPAAVLALLAIGLTGLPTPSPAQGLPTPELLQALKERLLEPPDCLPACAAIPLMVLETHADQLQIQLAVDAAEALALPIPANAGSWVPTEVRLEDKPLDQLRRSTDGTYLVPLPRGTWHLVLTGPLPPRPQVELPLPLRPHRVETAGDGWRVEGVDENGRPAAQLRLLRLGQQTSKSERLEPAELPPLLRVRRTLRLGVDWRIETQVIRLSPAEPPILMEVPLLPGEQVLTEGERIKDGRLLVSLDPGERETRWESSLRPVDSLTLEAPKDDRLSEEWRVDVSPLWHMQATGIPAIHHGGRLDRWLPTWRPWPGEQVHLAISRPEGVPGPTMTVDQSSYRVTPGRRLTEATLELVLRSSQGGEHAIGLPQGAELQQVSIDGTERPLRLEDGTLALPLVPGSQRFRIQWRQPSPLTTLYSPPAPSLGVPSVNASVQLLLGTDRWVLFTGGPRLGPAVLFWGLLLILVPIAWALGRSRLTPLRTADWLLLGVGLTQAGVWVGLLIVGWLFALGLRGRAAEMDQPWRFNLMQVGLVLLTLLALSALFDAVQQGLLGAPQMQIAGNGSSPWQLNWYQDRTGPELPRPWVVSVPILVYRGLMLAWALWLAFRLLKWLRWGWGQLSTPVLWREVKLKLPTVGKSSPPAGAA
jgi:hypothetical protein